MSDEQRGNELPKRYSPSEFIPYNDYSSYPQPPGYPPSAGTPNQGGAYPQPPVPPARPYPQQPVPPAWPYPQPPAQPYQPPPIRPFQPYRPGMAGPSFARPVQKRGWTGWWIAGILVILLVASVTSYFVIGFLNRSTPDKTLDAFCNALLQGDYPSAYDQFSAKLQHSIPEATFAGALTQDKVTACTHGSTGESGDSVTNNLTLVHASKGRNSDVVTLTKDSNSNWKIDDIFRQT